MPSAPPAYFDVYAKELSKYKLGHPLWVPDPEGNGEIRLGSVGYLKGGHFILLFHTFDPDHALGDVPDGFSAFQTPPSTSPSDSHIIQVPNVLTQPVLRSSSLEVVGSSANGDVSLGPAALQAGWKFRVSATSGAFLLLKGNCHQTFLRCDLTIKKYIKKNISSWLVFARERKGIDLKKEDIVFVSGFTKTAVSASACFHLQRDVKDVSFLATCPITSIVSGGLKVTFEKERSKPTVALAPGVEDAIPHATIQNPEGKGETPVTLDTRVGPPDLAPKWHLLRDEDLRDAKQFIFLEYYHVERTFKRLPVPRRIVAGAGPHQLPPGDPPSTSPSVRSHDYDEDEDEDEDAFEVVSEMSGLDEGFGREHSNPSGAVESLLDYILDHSDVDVACASHADIASLSRHREYGRSLADASGATVPQLSKMFLGDGRSAGYVASFETHDSDATSDSKIAGQTELPSNRALSRCKATEMSLPAALLGRSRWDHASPFKTCLRAGQTDADRQAGLGRNNETYLTRFSTPVVLII